MPSVFFTDKEPGEQAVSALRGHRKWFMGTVVAMLLVTGLFCVWNYGAQSPRDDINELFIDIRDGSIRDPQTKLNWTRQDNGEDINWYHAQRWCAFPGSRLPSVKELQGLVNQSSKLNASCRICKISPLLRLTSYVFWSGEANGPLRAYYVQLDEGTRGSLRVDQITPIRALCVRPS